LTSCDPACRSRNRVRRPFQAVPCLSFGFRVSDAGLGSRISTKPCANTLSGSSIPEFRGSFGFRVSGLQFRVLFTKSCAKTLSGSSIPEPSLTSLVSSLLHSHVTLKWCDEINLSNILLVLGLGSWVSGFRFRGTEVHASGFGVWCLGLAERSKLGANKSPGPPNWLTQIH